MRTCLHLDISRVPGRLIVNAVRQDLELPLNSSSWSEEDLKDPDKFYEMTVLLNAQREIADKFLDAQWQAKWRQEKVSPFLCYRQYVP